MLFIINLKSGLAEIKSPFRTGLNCAIYQISIERVVIAAPTLTTVDRAVTPLESLRYLKLETYFVPPSVVKETP